MIRIEASQTSLTEQAVRRKNLMNYDEDIVFNL